MSEKEGMFNDKNECVDLYIPRKCSVTNKIIHAKDKASVQINVGLVIKIREYVILTMN